MDCVAVYEQGKIAVREFRNLKKGDMVILGRTEDASDSIFVYTDGFRGADNLQKDGSRLTGCACTVPFPNSSVRKIFPTALPSISW